MYLLFKDIYNKTRLLDEKIAEYGKLVDQNLASILLEKNKENNVLLPKIDSILQEINEIFLDIINTDRKGASTSLLESTLLFFLSATTDMYKAFTQYQQGNHHYMQGLIHDPHPIPQKELQMLKASAWGNVQQALAEMRDLSLWMCHAANELSAF